MTGGKGQKKESTKDADSMEDINRLLDFVTAELASISKKQELLFELTEEIK